MLLLQVASFPLNDTPRPAGAVFFRSLIEPYSGIFDMALDMIGHIDLSNRTGIFMPKVLVSTHESPKFSKATCWHVMDAHIPYHNS